MSYDLAVEEIAGYEVNMLLVPVFYYVIIFPEELLIHQSYV